MRTLNKNNLVARSLSLPKGLATAAVSISLFLAACGDDNKNAGGTVEDQEVIAIADKTISGVSQKGPFVNGSSVTVQELDGETLAQTGNSYEGKIKNDMGEFSVKVAKLASQYALLKANGFYRNEVSGEKSKSQVTLYALTDLSNRDEVNVNLLTHLEYERSLYLSADDSVTVAAAKKQAEHEVLASFGIDGDFKSAEDLNIFGEDEGAAALLAISVLMQGDLNEADFSERLADYAADMETDGKWDDSKTATEIADWAAAKSLGQSLSYIREKITNWGLSADVPAFEKYVDNFWWQNYGLGTCNKKREGEVKKNENALSRNYSTYFICESGAWRVASDTEYDTYQQKCDEDGKIVFGNVNKDYAYDCDVQRWRHASNVEAALGGCVEKRIDEVAETAGIHYICQNREWRTATNIEKDTYKWLETVKKAKDGDVRYGDVIKTNCYVFEYKAWRSGNATDCSLGLRGCTALRQDTVGLGSDNVWYKCSSKQWKQASEFEKDTAAWGAGKFDGEIRSGQINTSVYYIYETDKSAWRRATDLEKDTYDYKKNKDWAAGQDGDSKYGSVNTKNCYVFEDKTWRSGNETDCTLRLRGCTALRQDTVGKGTDKMWHICDAKSWRDATTYEKDTFGWKDSTDGAIKKGNVTDTVYVFDKTAWRVTSNVEAKLGGCVSAIADSVGKVGSTYYICKSNKWVEASALEYDTYRWVAGKDGDSKTGSVDAKNCYVYENKAWRSGNAADCSLELRGCTMLRQDTVGLGSDKMWHICDAKSWRTATGIEKDTATWGTGEFDSEIRAGQVNKTIYYIYETSKNVWRNATSLEKDTYDHGNNKDWEDGIDGEIKKGSVTDSVYVFDATTWRSADNIEKVLGGCVASIQDSVGKAGDRYYICNPREWNVATTLQYDTYKQECSEFGQIVHGNVNTDYAYFCYGEEWKRFYGNENITYGKLVDNRDGRIYRTVKIGDQTWMAENLNYVSTEKCIYQCAGENFCSLCYGDGDENVQNCTKYGRLYSWQVAAIDYNYDESNSVHGVCPSGWHLPTKDEWNALYAAVGGQSTAGMALKSQGGWYNNGNGTDAVGFSVIPSGIYDCIKNFEGEGLEALFWSATQDDDEGVSVTRFNNKSEGTNWGFSIEYEALSVRCIKDEE